MSILMTNLFVVYVSAIFARINPISRKLETDYRKYNYLCIFIILVSLICVSGFRYYSGTDFGTYRQLYAGTPNFILKEESEWGFFLINKILYSISTNSQIMFFTYALITNILMVYGSMKCSTKFELSIYLYITTFCYYSTFNGMRQWVASAILFAGFQYMLKRDLKKYLIYVFIAYTFHNSSLVMIPMYFIVNRKFMSKWTLIIIGAFVFSYVFYNGFLETLFNMLQGTKYEHYQAGMEAWQEGAGMIRVIVNSVPLIATIFFRKNMVEENTSEVDILMNLCLMSALFMLLGTRHVFFVRMNLIFDIYYILLLPKLTQLKDIRACRFMYYSLVVFYFAYSYALLVGHDANVIPYQTNFNLF